MDDDESEDDKETDSDDKEDLDLWDIINSLMFGDSSEKSSKKPKEQTTSQSRDSRTNTFKSVKRKGADDGFFSTLFDNIQEFASVLFTSDDDEDEGER